MGEIRFSLGYNHDFKLLDLLGKYRENIESFYFPIPYRYLGSGRLIPQGEGYYEEINEIIKKCNFLKIRPQMLLNATNDGNFGLGKNYFSRILDYLQEMESSGLKSVIVANPIYISEIRKQIKSIEIESSVNCYVKTVEHALYLKDLGVDVITIDRDINREFSLISKIRLKTGLKIKVMLNEGCLRNCPFRNMHYNFLSLNVLKPKKLLGDISLDSLCSRVYLRHPEKVFSIPFIPPDTVSLYASVADYYKLSTRAFSTQKIEFCLNAYIKQDFNGDLLEILDCPGLAHFNYIDYAVLKKHNFFSKISKCDNDCGECNYCNKLIKKAVIINSNYLNSDARVKEDEKAIKIYSRVLKASPKEVSIYLRISTAYFNLKKEKRALKYINRALRLNSKAIGAYLILGAYYERSNNAMKALAVYKKALRLFPHSGEIYFFLGRTYFSYKKYKEAVESLKEALRSNYNSLEVYLLLGSCYEKSGQYKKSINELRSGEITYPNEAKINFLLVKCYRKIGQVGQANKELDNGFRKFLEKRRINGEEN
ncbi:MAG: tetratricopeptide repeat protein [Candidatus Omnitrophota bacterium]|jgi:tetratricopeptide (TPR) repeat protein